MSTLKNLIKNNKVVDGNLALNNVVDITDEPAGTIKTMKLNTSVLNSTQPYQRDLDQKKIAVIVSNFNIHKFGIIKVSYRDGVYYVYDGQHRLAAIKTKNGGRDCLVECEVHYGLTYEDEARLFAEQYDGATKVDIVYKWRAMYEGRLQPVYEIVNSCKRIGIDINFSKSKTNNRIICLGELQKMWNKLKAEDTLKAISLIKETWNGDMNSFNKSIVAGMKEFYAIYKDEINEQTFVKQLRRIEPAKIEALGNSDMITRGDLKYAKVIWDVYNRNLRENNRLDYKFKG